LKKKRGKGGGGNSGFISDFARNQREGGGEAEKKKKNLNLTHEEGNELFSQSPARGRPRENTISRTENRGSQEGTS